MKAGKIVLIMLSVLVLSVCQSGTNIKKTNEKEVAKVYNSEELIEDLDYMFQKLEKLHPNPYHYADKEKVYEMRKNAEKTIKKNGRMSWLKYWTIVSPMITELRDHHTTLYCEKADAGYFLSNANFTTPLGIGRKTNGKSYILYCDSRYSYLTNTQILSINGIDIDSIFTNIVKHIWASKFGYEDEFSIRMTNNERVHLDYIKRASMLYGLYDFKNEIKILYISGGKTNTNTTKLFPVFPWGKNYKTVYTWNMNKKSVKKKQYKLYWKIYEGKVNEKDLPKDTAYMQITSFDYNKFRNYKTTLIESFKELKEKKIKNLIINIRNNGGGSDRIWTYTLNYLYSRPYKINYKNDAFTGKEWAKLFKLSEKEIEEFGWDKYHFGGKVYLIINPGVFSAAVTFANAMKYYDIATLAGYETGGYKTHFGEAKYTVHLPNTKIPMRISSKYFISLDGDESRGGVVPHKSIRDMLDTIFE